MYHLQIDGSQRSERVGSSYFDSIQSFYDRFVFVKKNTDPNEIGEPWWSEIRPIAAKNSPPSFRTCKKEGGEFLAFLQIPKIFRLRRALRGYFNGFIVFSRYLARRRRKILRFYASRTRFPFTKPMVLLQNTQNFRLRRKSSDQSQIMQKRRGGILSKGGNS